MSQLIREYSPKQMEFIRNANHRFNIKTGATRSGKTFLDTAYMIPRRITERRGKSGLVVIMGVTKETIERNVLTPMREIYTSKLVGEINNANKCRLFGEMVYCLGAEKKSQISKIRGSSIKYLYGDEMADWSEEVFNLIPSRLDKPYSVLDGALNPAHKKHWLKAKFLDKRDIDLYEQRYTIDDNPFLDPLIVKNMKKEYRGTVFYDRYILGLWADAEGAIYKVFIENKEDFYIDYSKRHECFYIDGIPQELEYINIGIDWGGNKSGHAFVATGITKNFENVIILKSRWHAAQGTTPEDVCNWAVEFINEVERDYGQIDDIYADSAEQLLINLLEQKTKYAVRNSLKKPIVDRIRFTVALMAQRRLFLTRECETVADFFESALYDSKSDEDKRLDDGSYDQDSGDAWEYSIERLMSYIIRELIKLG